MRREVLITFRAEADLIAALEDAADAAGTSRSATIRAALAEHLDLEAREPAA